MRSLALDLVANIHRSIHSMPKLTGGFSGLVKACKKELMTVKVIPSKMAAKKEKTIAQTATPKKYLNSLKKT